jgi:hypothetical protein
MRAAKGHCDTWKVRKNPLTPVGVMRAAKGHCDKRAGRLKLVNCVGVMRAAKGHCDMSFLVLKCQLIV